MIKVNKFFNKTNNKKIIKKNNKTIMTLVYKIIMKVKNNKKMIF